uniref:E3 ubiquitin-protein ligase TRIM8 n=1 Tax=Canis lupus familiaris TaxID=9615 RepID=A0A8C0TL33_CANLF
MAENWKNCFEEELICPICLHVFVEPVQLPCKHNFCRGCIGEAWAKDSGLVRCPECNQAYNQKPGLEKNLKLTNIVEKFNALHVEKPPAALHCVFCRRGPPLPAQKVCLRCEAPCCQSHVQTHLQQPSTARGHLLVEADDVRAWSCPQHNAYRLYHCEAEQVAVCQYCCYYSGAHQGHSVCDVEIRRNEIRKMLMKQQDRLEEREQDIEDQLYKLESDKRLVEEKVSQLKEEVRLQYEKLHQLLDEDLRQTVEVLDKAQAKFCSENAAQALHLGERMQEAKKLLGSLQLLFDKTEDVSFMKNTKSVKILMDRPLQHTGALPAERPPVSLWREQLWGGEAQALNGLPGGQFPRDVVRPRGQPIWGSRHSQQRGPVRAAPGALQLHAALGGPAGRRPTSALKSCVPPITVSQWLCHPAAHAPPVWRPQDSRLFCGQLLLFFRGQPWWPPALPPLRPFSLDSALAGVFTPAPAHTLRPPVPSWPGGQRLARRLPAAWSPGFLQGVWAAIHQTLRDELTPRRQWGAGESSPAPSVARELCIQRPVLPLPVSPPSLLHLPQVFSFWILFCLGLFFFFFFFK